MTKIKARESQNVEYKSSWHDEYLKWICGFANAQGAVMYFGVDNASRPRNRNIANAFFKIGASASSISTMMTMKTSS
jgi:predicted HTH transcriptional regulator